jgi:hypothetical protein
MPVGCTEGVQLIVLAVGSQWRVDCLASVQALDAVRNLLQSPASVSHFPEHVVRFLPPNVGNPQGRFRACGIQGQDRTRVVHVPSPPGQVDL